MRVSNWRYKTMMLFLGAMWLCIVYISGPVSDGTMLNAMETIEKLRSENNKLINYAKDIVNTTLSAAEVHYRKRVEILNKRLTSVSNQLDIMSRHANTLTVLQRIENELARRKVERVSEEFWFYIRNELKSIQKWIKARNGNKTLVNKLDMVLSDSSQYQVMLKNDINMLKNGVDKMEEWRMNESRTLGDLVQRRLRHLQNPENCNRAAKLLCRLKRCGYGCLLHHVTYCLITAYATGRTMILQSKGWQYAKNGFETVFQPVSETCDKTTNLTDAWKVPIIDSLPKPSPAYLPLAIPDDIADRMLRFHGDPPVWWLGQFVTYLTRPQNHLKDHLEESRKKLGFTNPVVGIHIRRTDKLKSEAQYHRLEEYMIHVEEWIFEYAKRHPGSVQPKIFLASDDPAVFPEAKMKYPKYTFISDASISKSASVHKRYNETSLRGVIADIHFLSLCDYIVCTFSSQVCRVAYELMQPRHGDASRKFKSLDDMFYFGGQNVHYMLVIEAHEPKPNPGGKEISMEPGDLIGMAGNHWNGFSMGKNKRTGKRGLFPSFKVIDQFNRVKMPTYPEVKEMSVFS